MKPKRFACYFGFVSISKIKKVIRRMSYFKFVFFRISRSDIHIAHRRAAQLLRPASVPPGSGEGIASRVPQLGVAAQAVARPHH